MFFIRNHLKHTNESYTNKIFQAQSTSAYKGRRYNPIVRPQSSVQVQQAAQPQRVVLPNQFQQQMIMVPTFK